MADPATVVIDNGTGYTKMGYAGNMEPSYLIPSVIAKNVPKVRFIPFRTHILSISSPRISRFLTIKAKSFVLFTARRNWQERQF